mmetsp:Transcript_11377/g.11386  ORF Transcript_11377/g.11386 Transcript_11377/m.11386 type:complete len:210 (-) Transcript_11377:530-1159(-)
MHYFIALGLASPLKVPNIGLLLGACHDELAWFELHKAHNFLLSEVAFLQGDIIVALDGAEKKPFPCTKDQLGGIGEGHLHGLDVVLVRKVLCLDDLHGDRIEDFDVAVEFTEEHDGGAVRDHAGDIELGAYLLHFQEVFVLVENVQASISDSNHQVLLIQLLCRKDQLILHIDAFDQVQGVWGQDLDNIVFPVDEEVLCLIELAIVCDG